MIAPHPAVTARPAELGRAYLWCSKHATAWHHTVRDGCRPCAEAGQRPRVVEHVAAASPRPRSGALTEIALDAALSEAGYVAVTNATERTDLRRIYVPEFTWAPHERQWRADFAFPVARVLVEIDGNAHAVKRQRTADVLKRQEAERRGWRVVAVLPEQVRDGSAVALVLAAVAQAGGRGA